MWYRQLILLLLILSTYAQAKAEYRVFELEITNPDTGKKRTVVTTLDPFQYIDYYHVLNRESVYYTRTWMCYGDTSGYKEPCPPPSREPSNVKTPTENLEN